MVGLRCGECGAKAQGQCCQNLHQTVACAVPPGFRPKSSGAVTTVACTSRAVGRRRCLIVLVLLQIHGWVYHTFEIQAGQNFHLCRASLGGVIAKG